MRHLSVAWTIILLAAAIVHAQDNSVISPATQPIDLTSNPNVQKALDDQTALIQSADADYAQRLDVLNASHQRKLDAARAACVTALRRAQAVSNAMHKTDEALDIGALADSIQQDLSSAMAVERNGGWTVLFRSTNPSIWNTNTDRGPDSFAVSLDRAPLGIQYLKIAKPDGTAVIVSMSTAQLGSFQSCGKGIYGWEGENVLSSKAYHLGVWSTAIDRPQGSVDICQKFWGIAGWGFGNHNQLDDAQGFGWGGVEVGPTVFEISVKTAPLTDAEKANLKQ